MFIFWVYSLFSFLNSSFFIYKMGIIATSQDCWKKCLVDSSALYQLCQRSPHKPLLGSVVHWQDSGLIVCLGLWFITAKGKAKSGKGKGTWGQVWRRPCASFQQSSCTEVTQVMLNSSKQWVVTTCVKYCLPGKLIRALVPRVFIGSLSRRYSPPGTYQNCRLQEGKQVCSINPICTV